MSEAINVLDFMGYTTRLPGSPCTKCKCGIEGEIIKNEKIRKWYHWFIPLMWECYTAMDADLFCDSYKCPKCARTWRTVKAIR